MTAGTPSRIPTLPGFAFRTVAIWTVLLAASAPTFGRNAAPAPTDAAAPAWPLWNAYKTHFVAPSGRVIDHDASDRTTSEGQAYAMFFSLVADDRGEFEALLQWTVENLAQGDLTAHLPAWEWGHAPDGSWRVLDSNSAADADLWMCYTLLQAGHLWNQPRYRSLGLALGAQIAQRETKNIPGLGWMLLPAANGFQAAAQLSPASASNTPAKDNERGTIWMLNPSYSPLPVLTGMALDDPHGPWRSMANSIPGFVRKSSLHGFSMDWVTYRDGRIVPGVLPQSPPGAQPVGSYDAVRVYLWAGIAPAHMPGARALLQATSGMQRYLADHPIPPRTIDAQGNVTAQDGPAGFSAALLPYLAALHATRPAAQQRSRLVALLNPETGLYGSPPRYYDQNLALFAEGWQQQRYRFSVTGELLTRWEIPAQRDGTNHRNAGPQ